MNDVSMRKQGEPRAEVSQLCILNAAAALVALLLAIAVVPGAAFAQEGDLVAGAAVVPDLTTQSYDQPSDSIPTNATEIALGETKVATINSENDYVYWFKFKPTQTGVYVFEASMSGGDSYGGDPYGALYQPNETKDGLVRVGQDDQGAGSDCFKITYGSMLAGTTYYLACSEFYDESAEYAVSVTTFDQYDFGLYKAGVE